MSSTIATDLKSPSDIIKLSKDRRLAGKTDTAAARNVVPRAQALTLPEDVVTLSSQLAESNPIAVRRNPSLAVTQSEKKALLEPGTSLRRLSIYG